jgi:hypothetical protein
MMMKAMSTDLSVIDLESFCGFCHSPVSADLEKRRKHMFECDKHPAYWLNYRYKQIGFVVLAAHDYGAQWALERIQEIIDQP